MVKIRLVRIILISVGIPILLSCFFPKIVFRFRQQNEPPFAVKDRFKKGDQFTQEIGLSFSQAGNSFLTTILISRIFVNSPYSKLHIEKIAYEYEGISKILCENQDYRIIDYYIDTEKRYYIVKTMEPMEDYHLIRLNFQKIFSNKKLKDEFPFKITIQYSFDEGPEKTLILDYSVIAGKGRYVSPFFF